MMTMSHDPRHARIVRILALMSRSPTPMRDAMEAFPAAAGEELKEAWIRRCRLPRRGMWIHRNDDVRRRIVGGGGVEQLPRGAA